MTSGFRFRDLDPIKEKWAEIERYNTSVAERLPPGVKSFVLSPWHYDASDPRCPHVSWISAIEVIPDESGRQIGVVRLVQLGAYHDRLLSFTYAGVKDFSIEGQLVDETGRMFDWLYDEVHLCDSGDVERLIEFERCTVRIECADFSVNDSPLRF